MSCCGISLHSGSDADSDEENKTSYTEPRFQSDVKRIILTIEGLKCGCCESGISRVLAQIPAVQNHQVNIVLARVEFDLDIRASTVGKVKRKLTAATGFTFKEYFQPDGQVLEINVHDPAEIHRAGRPYGVTLVEQNNKSIWTPRILSGRNSAANSAFNSPISKPWPKPNANVIESPAKDKKAPKKLLQPKYTVYIHYDAKKIGPRDVLRYYDEWSEEEIQLAPPAPHPSLATGSRQAARACQIFILAAVFTFPVLFFAWGPIDPTKIIYSHLSLAFASVVQAIAIWQFFPGACRTLIHSRMFDMESLVAISTTVAYVFSVISYTQDIKGEPLETGSFFETSTLLVSLILLGRVVGEFARSRAAKSVSFRSLQVEEALLVVPGAAASSPSDPETRLIDSRLLQYGDHFKVLPESRIVTDGIVVHGGSEVDESMITGETLPVAKGRTSFIHAGTNNGSGTLIIALTKLPHENSISRIATLVENTELTKPKVQAIADRIAAWFVPVIIFIASSVFLIWFIVDKYHNHLNSRHAAINAFTYAIATFVVSCPCAIGLAVPMVILIASGVAARSGIIFRDPQKLETARNVTDVVFDKTGTLTTGVLKVTRAKFENGCEKQAIRILLGMLSSSKHPVSVAVYDYVSERAIETSQDVSMRPTDMSSIQSFPGEGIQGTTKAGNHLVRAGNPEWLCIPPSKLDFSADECDHTLLCVTIDGTHRATFFLESHLRPTAKATIKYLHSRGLRAHMLTGDHEGAATAVAHALDIPPALVRSRFKPEDKRAYVSAQQADGRTVMFIGDGTNDAIALKQSTIGVHLNRGSDVARSAADIVLMNPHLLDVLTLLDISRAAYKRIILNFVWSAVYNVLAVLLAAGALRVWRIEPRFAGLGEMVSVVPVVGVAFSMKWRRYGRGYAGEVGRGKEEAGEGK